MPGIAQFRIRRADDPDGSRVATIMRAYFQVERAQRARRLIWRRLLASALLWLLTASISPALPRRIVAAGMTIFAAVAAGGAVAERRAGKKLSALLDGQ